MERIPPSEASSHSAFQEITQPKDPLAFIQRACHWAIPWARWIQSALYFCLPSGLFPSDFQL